MAEEYKPNKSFAEQVSNLFSGKGKTKHPVGWTGDTEEQKQSTAAQYANKPSALASPEPLKDGYHKKKMQEVE